MKFTEHVIFSFTMGVLRAMVSKIFIVLNGKLIVWFNEITIDRKLRDPNSVLSVANLHA